MNEYEAYEKLQDILTLAEELIRSEHYVVEEIVAEIKNRLDVG